MEQSILHQSRVQDYVPVVRNGEEGLFSVLLEILGSGSRETLGSLVEDGFDHGRHHLVLKLVDAVELPEHLRQGSYRKVREQIFRNNRHHRVTGNPG